MLCYGESERFSYCSVIIGVVDINICITGGGLGVAPCCAIWRIGYLFYIMVCITP